MLGTPLHPREGALFGLNFGVFFFLFPAGIHHSKATAVRQAQHAEVFHVFLSGSSQQTKPFLQPPWWESKAQKVMASISIQSQNWETLGFYIFNKAKQSQNCHSVLAGRDQEGGIIFPP